MARKFQNSSSLAGRQSIVEYSSCLLLAFCNKDLPFRNLVRVARKDFAKKSRNTRGIGRFAQKTAGIWSFDKTAYELWLWMLIVRLHEYVYVTERIEGMLLRDGK